MAAYEFTVAVGPSILKTSPTRTAATTYLPSGIDTQYRPGAGPAHFAPLGHHGRQRQGRGSEGTGRGRPPASVETGRAVRLHQRHSAENPAGLDVGRLLLRGRRRHPFEAPVPEFVLSLPRTLH